MFSTVLELMRKAAAKHGHDLALITLFTLNFDLTLRGGDWIELELDEMQESGWAISTATGLTRFGARQRLEQDEVCFAVGRC